MQPNSGPEYAGDRDPRPWPPSRVFLIYVLAGAGWIYFSDAILLSTPAGARGLIQTSKGILFVLVTGVLLWLVLKGWLRALDRSNAHLHRINQDLALTQFAVDRAPDAVYWIDASGAIVYANDAAARSVGLTRSELARMTIFDIDPSFSAEKWKQHWVELQEKGSILYESTHRSQSGTGTHVEIAANAVSWNGRQINCAFVRDISHRLRAEYEAREHERLFTTLLDSMPGYAFIKDRSGKYLIANRRLCDDLGLAPSEIVGKTDRDLFAAEADRVENDDRQIFTTGEPLYLDEECVHIRGKEAWFTTRKLPLFDEQGRVDRLIGLAIDTTERRRAQSALRETEHQFRAAMIAAPIPVMMHAADGRILLLSRAWTELSGYSEADLPTTADWLDKAQPRTPEGTRQTTLRYDLAERTNEGLASITTRSGRERTWDLWSAPLGSLPDGNKVVVTMAVDVTDRDRLEQQFLQAQKMEAVGRLAGGVAHDFNNLLTVIIGFSQWALEDSRGTPAEQSIEHVLSAAQRGAGLTTQLLAFSRRHMVQPEVLPLNPSIISLEQMLRRIIGEDIRLIVNLSPSAGNILIDPTQFDQVLLNLVVNARDAMPDGGTLSISTVHCVLDKAEPATGLGPGAWEGVIVTDTGSGMTSETRERLFEPFFTTKDRGKGTGLGLATVHGIVQQAGGVISVDSAVGQGATFALYFPSVASAQESKIEPAPHPDSIPASARVVVLEDDASVGELIRAVLTESGFEVVMATGSDEVLTCFSQVAGNHVSDVLLTDIVLPQTDGVEVARKVLEASPRVKIVYMSGYAETNRPLPGDAVFLRKPFKPDVLVQRIRDVLA
jgi:PAS domain S-box-containing protein